MTRRILAAAALLAALAPQAARAQEALGVLAVADPPGPGAELASAAEALRAALAARAPGVLAAAELRARMAGRPPPSSLAELDRAYAGAIAAHAGGDFEGSLRTLRAVIDALEALPDGADTFAQWTRAMLRLARSEQELGRRVEAQRVLERLLRAGPETRPDARQFPPSFLALLEDARQRLAAEGLRRLTIEAHPEARIFVEGRDVGPSPVVVSVPPGRYRVSGVRAAVRAPAVVVDVFAEDGVVRIDMSLAEALRPDAGPGLALAAADRPQRIVTAASRLGLDRAVTASLARDGEVAYLVATLHDVRRGTAEREGRLRLSGGAPPGGIEALAGFLATGERSALVSTAPPASLSAAAPRDAPVPLAPPPANPPSRAYGWAALGTGLAALAAGGVAAYHGHGASEAYGDARQMLEASGRVRPGLSIPEYNALVRDGDRHRDAALGAGVGTGVGVAVTAVLAYVSWRRTGEVGPFRF